MLEQVSLYAVLHRILNELNSNVVEHGNRVSYLFLKLAREEQKM